MRTFTILGIPFAVNGDEVLFFSRALRIVHGQVLYRDVFELVTPGTELLYAIGFRVFGVKGWVIEAWHVCLGVALCLVITCIARRILTGVTVFLPMLLFLAFDFSVAMDATHHWWSTLFALLAVSMLIRGHDDGRLVLCGTLCGVSILFTQTQGAMVFLAIVTYLVIDAHTNMEKPWRRLAFFSFPCVSLCAAVLGYFCYKAGVYRVFYDIVVFPVTGLSGPVNSPRTYLHQFPPFHRALDLFRFVPFLIILVLTPYCYLLSLYWLWTKRGCLDPERRKQIILFNLVGVALFAAISTGPRFFRICTVAPPALLVFTWHIQHATKRWKHVRFAIWALTGIFMVWLPINRQIQWRRTLSLPTGKTVFTDVGQWQEYGWLQQRTSAGDTLFNDAGAILYLGLQNPMDVEFVGNDDLTPVREVQLILDRMETSPPKYLVLIPGMSLTPYDHSAPFRDYVHKHYCLQREFLIGTGKFVEEMWGSCSKDRVKQLRNAQPIDQT